VRAEAHHYHRLDLADEAGSVNKMKSAALTLRPDHALTDKLAFAFETRVDFALGDVSHLRSLLRTDTQVGRALGGAGLRSSIEHMLVANDYSACRAVGHAMANAGFDGLFAETARPFDHLVGTNVVLFGADGDSFVRELDPTWMLIAAEDEAARVIVTAYPQKEGILNRVGRADALFQTRPASARPSH
jgi:hypothetical protein